MQRTPTDHHSRHPLTHVVIFCHPNTIMLCMQTSAPAAPMPADASPAPGQEHPQAPLARATTRLVTVKKAGALVPTTAIQRPGDRSLMTGFALGNLAGWIRTATRAPPTASRFATLRGAISMLSTGSELPRPAASVDAWGPTQMFAPDWTPPEWTPFPSAVATSTTMTLHRLTSVAHAVVGPAGPTPAAPALQAGLASSARTGRCHRSCTGCPMPMLMLLSPPESTWPPTRRASPLSSTQYLTSETSDWLEEQIVRTLVGRSGSVPQRRPGTGSQTGGCQALSATLQRTSGAELGWQVSKDNHQRLARHRQPG